MAQNGGAKGRKKGDEALINALAVGVSVPTAADHAGLSKRTAYRRLEDAAFRARVDEARAGIVSAVVGRLSGIGAMAGDTLKDLLRDKSSSIRLGATRTALDMMFRGNEQDTLARQLRELRLQVQGLNHQAAGPDINATESAVQQRKTSHAQSNTGPGPQVGGGPAAGYGHEAGAGGPPDDGNPAVETPPRPADDCVPNVG